MIKAWLNEKFIAHRGFHTESISENTLNAFENAILHHYNIELDVQATKDNQVVVYHDTNMGRLTNCKEFVEDISYNDIKNKVRYLKTQESIPLFSEVLKLCEGKTGIMVEIKKQTYDTKEIRVEPLVYELLKDYQGDFIVKSFDPYSVKWFLDHAPSFTIGFLCEYDCIEDYPVEDQSLVKEILFTGKRKVDFFDYAVGKIGSPIWNSVQGKMPCYVWVVRDQKTQDEVKNIVDNIIFENYVPKGD